MKQFLSIFFLLLCFGVNAQKSIPKPTPARLVNDLAKVLHTYDAEILEKKLVAFDDSTSNQIVVLTIPSLNGEIIEDVAVKTFREWGIGNKKTNNGVLLLIALNDKKIRIEVGYGLEGAITDVISKDIINNDLKPAFQQKNFIGGINKAVDDIAKAAVGEYKVKHNKSSSSNNSGGSILVFIIILIIILIIVGGGGGGGRRGRIGASDIILPMIFSNLGNGGGGGGGWSDGGGGGFGGFGGGSSGGGGASGDW